MLLGPVRQVGERAVLHLPTLAKALAQKDRRWRASIGHPSHVNV